MRLCQNQVKWRKYQGWKKTVIPYCLIISLLDFSLNTSKKFKDQKIMHTSLYFPRNYTFPS